MDCFWRGPGDRAHVAKDNDDPTRRLLLPVKNSFAEDTGGLAYRIEEGRLE